MNKRINYKYLNILLILGIIYLLFLMKSIWLGALYKVLSIIFPFFISFIVAYALDPAVEFLTNRKVPKSLAIFIIVGGLLLIVGLTCYYAVPVFFEQLINLMSILGKLTTNVAVKYDVDLSVINEFINNFTSKIFGIISGFISDGTIINIVSKSIDYASKIIIIFIVSLYLLIDMPKIKNKVKNFLYYKDKKKYKLISDVNKEVYSYLKGFCIFLIVQFFEYTFLFLIIGHPNFLLIGVLASITTIIPYFGGFITNVIALIIASTISSKLFILTLIITIVAPNIDGYIISPKIYGKTNQMPALLSIFAVFAGGALFGFVGIIIAVPLTVIIMAIIKAYKPEITSKITNIKEKI